MAGAHGCRGESGLASAPEIVRLHSEAHRARTRQARRSARCTVKGRADSQRQHCGEQAAGRIEHDGAVDLGLPHRELWSSCDYTAVSITRTSFHASGLHKLALWCIHRSRNANGSRPQRSRSLAHSAIVTPALVRPARLCPSRRCAPSAHGSLPASGSADHGVA